MRAIEKLEEECENDKGEYDAEQTANKAKALFDKIKAMRRESLKKGGEMSAGNIIFKCLRRFNYIARLADVKSKTYDKIYSIK